MSAGEAVWCSGYDIDLGPNASWSLTSHGSLGKSPNLPGLSFHIFCKKRVIRIPQWAFMRNKQEAAVKCAALYLHGRSP